MERSVLKWRVTEICRGVVGRCLIQTSRDYGQSYEAGVLVLLGGVWNILGDPQSDVSGFPPDVARLGFVFVPYVGIHPASIVCDLSESVQNRARRTDSDLLVWAGLRRLRLSSTSLALNSRPELLDPSDLMRYKPVLTVSGNPMTSDEVLRLSRPKIRTLTKSRPCTKRRTTQNILLHLA